MSEYETECTARYGRRPTRAVRPNRVSIFRSIRSCAERAGPSRVLHPKCPMSSPHKDNNDKQPRIYNAPSKQRQFANFPPDGTRCIASHEQAKASLSACVLTDTTPPQQRSFQETTATSTIQPRLQIGSFPVLNGDNPSKETTRERNNNTTRRTTRRGSIVRTGKSNQKDKAATQTTQRCDENVQVPRYAQQKPHQQMWTSNQRQRHKKANVIEGARAEAIPLV